MVSVLIPWRPGDAHREAACRWVTARYEALGWEVLYGSPPPGPWCKALAVSDALQRATSGLLVLADADAWCDDAPRAVEALATHQWAIPHRLVHRLTATATTDVLAGTPNDELDNPPYYGTIGGGIVAIRRTTYDEVPLDPRFLGWGGEDHAWGIALRSLAGRPWIGQRPLVHLWHPPQAEAPDIRGPRAKQTIPDPANRALDRRYRDAKSSARRMRALVDEAREATWQATSASS